MARRASSKSVIETADRQLAIGSPKRTPRFGLGAGIGRNELSWCAEHCQPLASSRQLGDVPVAVFQSAEKSSYNWRARELSPSRS